MASMGISQRSKVPQREAPTVHRFKVHICDFQCENLVANVDTCEAYLRIDFDNFKLFKTEHEPHNENPEWGFKAGFQYCMNYLEQLGRRDLKVQCFNKVNGHLIGGASVDLQTIACGPAHYQLTLRGGEQKEARGTLKFTCVMKMISTNLTIICQDLTLTMQGCYAPARLQISSTLDEVEHRGAKQVQNAPHSPEGVWPGPFSFVFETTLKDLLKSPSPECLRFVVIDEWGVRQGEALLEFRKAFSTKPDPICFKVPVTYTGTVDGEQEPESFGMVGELEGVILYQNLPVFAQLVQGLWSDGQVEGGHWFMEGLPYPQCMTEPPPVWQDPTDRMGFEFLCADQQQHDENESTPIDFDDRHLAELLVHVDLPPPWEKRRERAGGRMYFFDPRSRRMTWKDPRFLPENWDQKIDPQNGKVYFQYHKTRQTTYVDPRGCPPGWDMRLSKAGDIYFAHMPAMQTTFIDPRGLPEHVEPALDDLARMYFKNHESKTTCWEDPRIGQQEVVLAKWRHVESMMWLKEQVLREIEQRQELENREEEDAETPATAS